MQIWLIKPDNVSDSDWVDAWLELRAAVDNHNKYINRIIHELGYVIDYPNKDGIYKDKYGIIHSSDESYQIANKHFPYYKKDGIYYSKNEIHKQYYLENLPIKLSDKTKEILKCII